MVTAAIKVIRCNGVAFALDLNPAAGHTNLMIANQVVVRAVATKLPAKFVIFKKGWKLRAVQKDVKSDRLGVVFIECNTDFFRGSITLSLIHI